MEKAGYIRASSLVSGKLYYFLTSRGGEIIDLEETWYSSRYRPAKSTVINQLVLTDFALSMGIEYLSRDAALERFIHADYDAFNKISRLSDNYFVKDDKLNVLVIDNQLSMKYFHERIAAYSRLPTTFHDVITVVFLVFTEAKRKQVIKISADSQVRIKVMKANWKY